MIGRTNSGGGGEAHGAIIAGTVECNNLATVELSLNGEVIRTVKTDEIYAFDNIQMPGTYTITATEGENADTKNVTVTSDDVVNKNTVAVETISLFGKKLVTVYGGALETITSDGAEICTTDANGEGTAVLNVGQTYTLVGGVSGYEKTVTVQSSTNSIKVMPEGALYWYGNNLKYVECIYNYTSSQSYSFGTNSIYLSNCSYGIDFRTHEKINVNKYNALKITVNKRMDYYGGNIGLMIGTTSLTQYPDAHKNESEIKKYLGKWGYSNNNSSRGLFTHELDIADIDGDYYAQWNSYGSGNPMGQDLCALWLE